MVLYDLIFLLEDKGIIEIRNRERLYKALDTTNGALLIDGEAPLDYWDGTSWARDSRTYREVQKIEV